MRAVEPVDTGYAEREGVKLYWEEFGAGILTLVLVPSLVDRPLANLEGAGSLTSPATSASSRSTVAVAGRSDRLDAAEAYHYSEFAADTVAVLDATGTPDAVLVGFSAGRFCGA